MAAINNIEISSLQDSLISFSVAFFLGMLIGMERQYRQRTAGLRTNVLVALAAAAFVDIANRLNGHEGSIHILAYVVSGVGFLGAGVIMKDNGSIRGLNTAATLWGTAAVGASAGADMILESVLIALFVLAGNTLLRPVANAVNRLTMEEQTGDFIYTVSVICNTADKKEARSLLQQVLREAGHISDELYAHPRKGADVQIVATLASPLKDSAELDMITQQLLEYGIVTKAFWSLLPVES